MEKENPKQIIVDGNALFFEKDVAQKKLCQLSDGSLHEVLYTGDEPIARVIEDFPNGRPVLAIRGIIRAKFKQRAEFSTQGWVEYIPGRICKTREDVGRIMR